MTRHASMFLVFASIVFPGKAALAQHLWWDREGQDDATCLYGQITVLSTARDIYYCGANWHPGEPAGGYCGIQHNSETERRTIFSIWDTTDQLHPETTAAHPRTIHNRFGGEGEGQHTHMIWNWQLGDTFEFFLTKRPGAGDTTDTLYFVFDPGSKRWIHSATITNPIGGHKSVTTIGGSINSFLENFSSERFELPKVALYRLWLGKEVDSMVCLTRVKGNKLWGTLNDYYFLAEGDPEALKEVFATLKKKHKMGDPVYGPEADYHPNGISEIPMPKKTVAALKKIEKELVKQAKRAKR